MTFRRSRKPLLILCAIPIIISDSQLRIHSLRENVLVFLVCLFLLLLALALLGR